MEVKRDENGRVVSGVLNPNGRPPKGESLTEVLRERLDKEEIADRLIALAMDGDVPALKYIYDRIDGRPKESVSMEHKGGFSVSVLPDGFGKV